MGGEETIQKIVAGSGKSEEEVKELVAKKTEKFSGLLTESGAALMVAKELGIDLQLEKKPLERLSVSQLTNGMNNVEVLVRVRHVFSPKQFEKNGKKGILCSLIVADSSGEIRLTAWGRSVKKLADFKVQKGTALLLKDCYVSSYKDVPQLNLSHNSNMVVEPGVEEGLPPRQDLAVKLSELTANGSDVSVLARVLRKFPEKEFDKNGRSGRLVSFLIGDGNAVVRATAWNDAVDTINEIKEGESIKIEGAYTKEGLNGVELNLGYRSRVLQDIEEANALPPAEKMKQTSFKEKKISELGENDRFVKIEAEIVDVISGKLRFSVCPKCGKKIEAADGSFLCGECGEVKEDIRAVVGLKVRDESGEINTVLFAEVAEKAIGMNKEGLKKRLEVNTAEQLIAELRDSINGKKAVLSGSVKMNGYSNELEFNAREFEFA